MSNANAVYLSRHIMYDAWQLHISAAFNAISHAGLSRAMPYNACTQLQRHSNIPELALAPARAPSQQLGGVPPQPVTVRSGDFPESVSHVATWCMRTMRVVYAQVSGVCHGSAL